MPNSNFVSARMMPALERRGGGALVERDRGALDLAVALLADELDALLGRDVLVVAARRLRRRREERARQPVGLAQPVRQRNAADGARARRSPSSPSRRGSRARRTRAAASRAAARAARGRRGPGSRAPSGKSREPRRDHVVADDVAGQREPVQRERREHAALVGDRRRQDDVERRDAVRGDEQQAVPRRRRRAPAPCRRRDGRARAS